jgi:hypothetical protein
VKSIALEQANASRQIWSIKDGNKWAAPKVAAAQREAVERHAKYIDLFRVDSKLPDKLDEVWEEHVVTACVTLARAKLQLQVRLCWGSAARACEPVVRCLQDELGAQSTQANCCLDCASVQLIMCGLTAGGQPEGAPGGGGGAAAVCQQLHQAA